MIILLLGLLQGDAWTATPARPTVGDTIWLERTISAPAGWRIRAGKLDQYSDVEQLGDPQVRAARGGEWSVRYAVVAWEAGAGTVAMPALWRLAPDGTADSVPGGTVVLAITSVIPDSIRAPAPQPSLGLLRTGRPNPIPPVLAVVLAASLLVALILWRRRAPRAAGALPGLVLDPEVADQRWVAAGEPRAVAARATHQLRSAVAHAIPEAHDALSTAECLAMVEMAQPHAPLRELRELLQALDQVSFATAHGFDVAALAARARALAREFGGGKRGNGAKQP